MLGGTDVLLWWGHKAHAEVADAVVDRIQARVLDGMGLIVLHSAHFSKIFKRLMGTGCNLKWREADERERLWVVAPGHPIAAGLPERIDLEREEMYGEHFDIPAPDELVFVSWFQGGEVFRSGCCFHRGAGRIFYFRPGHETYPTYHQPLIQQVIANAVRWAAPVAAARPRRGNVRAARATWLKNDRFTLKGFGQVVAPVSTTPYRRSPSIQRNNPESVRQRLSRRAKSRPGV